MFQNRTEMDKAVLLQQDNVFAGRFVLIKYDPTSIYFQGDMLYGYLDEDTVYLDAGYVHPYLYTAFEQASSPSAANWDKYYYRYSPIAEPTENDYRYFKLPSATYFSENDIENYYVMTADAADQPYAVGRNQVIRIKTSDGELTGTFLICNGAQEDEVTASWIEIIEDSEFTNYIKNYQIDFTNYGLEFDTRGYDGTVWQKVYGEGVGRFVPIARLNGLVPGFSLIADAPSLSPAAPYVDTKGSDSFYKIHVPTHWGFQLKEAEEEVNEETHTITYPLSDVLVDGQHQDIYLNLGGPQVNNQQVYHSLESHKDTETLNTIALTPTGASGATYNGREAQDMLELSIHLPVVGNMIDAGYDLIYGANPETNKRYTDVNWYPGNEQALILNGDAALGGKTFDLNTIAGSLNTIHNRLGQIIVPIVNLPDENSYDFDNLSDKYIYHYAPTDKYYRKGIKYIYHALDNNMVTYDVATEIASEDDFKPYTYYYDDGSGHKLMAATYDANTTYYKKKIVGIRYTLIENGLEMFVSGEYFLKEGSNYYRDNSPEVPSNPDRIYYTIDETAPNRTTIPGTYFSGQYSVGSYYYEDEDENLILAMDAYPDPEITYYALTNNEYFNNYEIVFYQKNKFYYQVTENNHITYRLCTEDTYVDAVEAGHIILYWLEFDMTRPTLSLIINELGEEEQRITYPLKEAHQISNIEDYPDAETLEHLYYEDSSHNLYTFEYINTHVVSDGTPPYAIARSYRYITDITAQTQLYVTGKYYILTDPDRHYLISYDNWNRNNTYYLIDEVEQVERPFYLPGKYYYEQSPDNYRLDNAAPAIAAAYDHYEKTRLFVTSDTQGDCPYGYEWNDYSIYIPASITLSTREERYGLVEIDGLANGNSTINGFLLQLDQQFNLEDYDTRNTRTFRGAMNILLDYLYCINKLEPNKVVYVNSFGQITSSSIDLNDIKNLIAKAKTEDWIP